MNEVSEAERKEMGKEEEVVMVKKAVTVMF